jgi:hypothetical protein
MFLWMVRASLRQIAIAGVVLITSWWVLLMAPVTMQESLHQSVMIVMAAFVARLLHADAHRQGLLLLTGVIILAVSSVLRPTNWIVAIPLVAIGLARRPFLAVTATVVVAAGVPGFWFIWRYLSAPIPDLPIELHEIAGGHGTTRVLQYLVEQLPVNIAQIFDVGAFVQRPFDQHVMFEAAALAGVSALLVVRAAVKGRSRDLSFKVDVFNASALGMALVAFLGFYFDDGGSQSRVTAPFLLLSMLVLVATGCRAWLVFGIIAAQLMVAPSFVMRYRDWRLPAYTYDRSTAEQFQREITPLLPFAEGQGPWCNTLLTNIYPPEIAFVPPGIGLTMGYRAELLATPFKSRYVLLAHKDAVYGETPRFRPLGTTILGSLYLNLAAACE